MSNILVGMYKFQENKQGLSPPPILFVRLQKHIHFFVSKSPLNEQVSACLH